MRPNQHIHSEYTKYIYFIILFFCFIGAETRRSFYAMRTCLGRRIPDCVYLLSGACVLSKLQTSHHRDIIVEQKNLTNTKCTVYSSQGKISFLKPKIKSGARKCNFKSVIILVTD